MNNIFKARKRPIEVNAVLWDGTNLNKVIELEGTTPLTGEYLKNITDLAVANGMRVRGCGDIVKVGDYVIKGVDGNCYPCPPNVFKEVYEVC